MHLEEVLCLTKYRTITIIWIYICMILFDTSYTTIIHIHVYTHGEVICVFSSNSLGYLVFTCQFVIGECEYSMVISGDSEVVFIALTCRESRNRCKTRDNTSAATCMYEEVNMKKEDKKSHDIQLTANEAYASLHKGSIQTSPNTTST